MRIVDSIFRTRIYIYIYIKLAQYSCAHCSMAEFSFGAMYVFLNCRILNIRSAISMFAIFLSCFGQRGRIVGK